MDGEREGGRVSFPAEGQAEKDVLEFACWHLYIALMIPHRLHSTWMNCDRSFLVYRAQKRSVSEPAGIW